MIKKTYEDNQYISYFIIKVLVWHYITVLDGSQKLRFIIKKTTKIYMQHENSSFLKVLRCVVLYVLSQ
jgi:hypothetical protein